ncbi:hypothetical protein M501DRAFT_1003756 [Patellaria atrata CBS 101060]|uniref:Beta/gamma crystallin 'Greek key' domain-containing protein n=1 Tax=Patellaria atrata CBS 101060 TaxID=1346257 RepID=A0A9P4VRU1_9PEZI|nr:hypothetical protein M501DRAFT_1003756 [Patellaria atrata CBS 101060]
MRFLPFTILIATLFTFSCVITATPLPDESSALTEIVTDSGRAMARREWRICTAKGFHGDCESYNYNDSECVNLNRGMNDKAEAFEVQGDKSHCVLYADGNCKGSTHTAGSDGSPRKQNWLRNYGFADRLSSVRCWI